MPNARVLSWSTVAVCTISGVAAFWCLYRLRDDPLESLGDTFRFAAFLQPIPYLVVAILALVWRNRTLLSSVLIAATACGAFGWWWLSGLQELRKWENEPTTRNGLGNLWPDMDGQIRSIEAIAWPFAVAVLVGTFALVGWSISRTKRRREIGNGYPDSSRSLRHAEPEAQRGTAV